MRVLHVIGQLVPGGSEKVTLLLAKACRAHGHEHRIVVLGETDHEFVASLGGEGVPLDELELPGRGALSGARAIRAVRELTRKHDAELLHGHAWRSSITAGIVGRLTGRHAVATLHRIYYPRMERVLDRFAQRLWAGVVVDSQTVKELLVEEAGIDDRLVEVIPNFVDEGFFSLAPLSSGNGSRPTRLLMAAHFTAVKGHRFALQALARLEQAGPGRFELDLLGEGPLMEESRQAATRLGIGQRVHFRGRRSDLKHWLRRSDVVLLPSLWEGFGVILAEAMACGKPGVSFAVGGAREVIVDGETGVLVQPGDSDALADALERLHGDPDLRERLGHAGRIRAEQLYSVRGACERYESFYEDVVGEL